MPAASKKAVSVVYCFQNCIFVGEFTAQEGADAYWLKLCIAFKIVSL